jgi:hypothetical protein
VRVEGADGEMSDIQFSGIGLGQERRKTILPAAVE